MLRPQERRLGLLRLPQDQRRRPTPLPGLGHPKGWNRRKVEAVIRHYERQTDDQAIAKAEAAYRNQKTTMMQIPVKLVPEVQKLLAKRAG